MSKRKQQRLHHLVLAEGDFVARSLRNLGVFGGDLDDCVQQVFLAVAPRLDELPVGQERAFLFGCARNVAAHFRRGVARKREVSEEYLPERSTCEVLPEQLVDDKRYRELLDEILDCMDETFREVFVLHAFEELTMAEIAKVLDIPPGTVASRLRRSRELFQSELLRRKSRPQRESA